MFRLRAVLLRSKCQAKAFENQFPSKSVLMPLWAEGEREKHTLEITKSAPTLGDSGISPDCCFPFFQGPFPLSILVCSPLLLVALLVNTHPQQPGAPSFCVFGEGNPLLPLSQASWLQKPLSN